MASIISSITSVITAAGGWITSTLGTITAEGNELLLFGIIMGFVGIGISLVQRVLKLHA